MIHRDQSDDAARRNGISSVRLDELAQVFAAMLEEGLHPGAQLAVWRNGELIIDLAGGVDGPDARPVTPQTLFQIRSATKSLACTVMHMLHDAKLFSYEDRIVKYWPEFGKNGKEQITIAQVMSHRAGLTEHRTIPIAVWADRKAVAEALENMTPAWPPGTANGYHASSIGWIVDELVLRLVGRSTGQLLREKVTAPLGVEDVYLGVPEAELPRMAKMVVMGDVQAGRVATSDALNDGFAVRLPLSWISGLATARDVAKLTNLWTYEGTYLGHEIVSSATMRQARVPTNSPEDIDRGLDRPIRWGLGYILGVTTPDIYGTPPHTEALGHAGGGASVIWGDPEARLGVAFLCNGMQSRGRDWDRYRRVGDAIYGLLAG